MPAPTTTTRSVGDGICLDFDVDVTICRIGNRAMAEFETVNFFKDRAIQDDPFPYFDWLRSQHPVWQEPNYSVYMVTGHAEAMAVYNDATNYSSCNTIAGPFVRFSVPLEGDDVSEIIDEHRHEL